MLNSSVQQSITFIMHFRMGASFYRILASTFEWWVLNAYRGVNTERACFTNQGGSTRSFEEMRVAGCSPLMVEYFFSMAGKIQALQLDNAALSLLAALCLTGKGEWMLYIEPYP